jgi:adhesin transport system membrane fusion protein
MTMQPNLLGKAMARLLPAAAQPTTPQPLPADRRRRGARTEERGRAMNLLSRAGGPLSMSLRDLPFTDPLTAAVLDAPRRTATLLLAACFVFFGALLAWAHMARLDEIARGDGQVVPSSRKQMVQSLEGGIVSELHVREGARVEKGQVVLTIDDTGFASNLGEIEAKTLALTAELERLASELESPPPAEPRFSAELTQRAPRAVRNETDLFHARRESFESQRIVLAERLQQRRIELIESHEQSTRLQRNHVLLVKEHALKAPMAKSGVVPKTEMLQLERQIADLEGQIKIAAQAIPRAEAAVREAQQLHQEQRLAFNREAQRELNQRRAELSVLEQTIRGAKDRVARASVRSPVTGIVNKLHVTTVGGVVKPGEPLIEITPVEDSLLVQARLRPQDIAFVHPGQKALVKITAYDFSIYGGLEGKVEQISPDSFTDERTREPYYQLTVRTERSALVGGGKSLPIMPGMIATVDILTGEKSVLDYLLKPINKARQEAMRER